jgi:ribosome biogenesis protein UTP30
MVLLSMPFYTDNLTSNVPHPFLTKKDTRICLITADPPAANNTAYKDLIASPAFPADLRERIPKVIAISRLKAKYKTFEEKRKLLAEYDLFLADERIITGLPGLLGKVFFKSTSKRPVPVDLTGKLRFNGQGRPDKNKLTVKKSRNAQVGGSEIIGAPADVAKEIEKTLSTTLVHLAPAATTSVKAALADFTAKQVAENVQAVVEKMVEQYIPKKWRGVKSIHVKTPTSAALPIWLADELWADEEQVLNTKETPKVEPTRPQKKRKSTGSGAERATKKAKSITASGAKPVKV